MGEVVAPAPHSPLAHALNRLAQKRLWPCVPVTSAKETSPAESEHQSLRRTRHDRRRFPRRISRCSVTVCAGTHSVDGSSFQQAWLLHSSRIKGRLSDISRNGLAMTLGRPLEVGQLLCMKIENPLFSHRLITVSEVVRQQPDEHGNWLVMCRFANPLEPEQIQFFGQHLFTARVV